MDFAAAYERLDAAREIAERYDRQPRADIFSHLGRLAQAVRNIEIVVRDLVEEREKEST